MPKRFVLLACLLSAASAWGCSGPTATGADAGGSAPDAMHFVAVDASSDAAPTCSCDPRPHSTATCGSGGCEYACLPDFFDCDGQPGNGCEADLMSSGLHCGTCQTKCGAKANATTQCVQGQCKSVCDLGKADCNGGGDGCETDTDGSIDHCGDCGVVCSAGPHSKAACSSGACKLACDGGFADCNGLSSDGCEVDAGNDPQHCGTCGIACNGGKCVNGACQCAAISHSAKLIPLDMYIMMDQSSSMADATGAGPTKWEAIAQAIDAFVKDPKSAGIGVGIQYFPLKFGTSKGSCNASDYAKPEVAIAPLPANAQAITASVAKHGPTPSTPTFPALTGAVSYAQTYAAANPAHTVAVVLATDGEPTECAPLDIPSVAGVAAKGLTGPQKVLTFVIGVGTSLGNLDAIAKAGGSQKAFLVDAGGDVVQQFSTALAAIHGQALACAYEIPKPDSGLPTEFDKVNVQVTLGAAAPAVLPYVDSEANCDPQKGGWHYDDAKAPTQILLCAQSCGAVAGDAVAQVDVLLGCARTGKE